MLFLIKHSLHTNILVGTVFITRGPSAFSVSHQFRHKWVDSINGNYRNIYFFVQQNSLGYQWIIILLFQTLITQKEFQNNFVNNFQTLYYQYYREKDFLKSR